MSTARKGGHRGQNGDYEVGYGRPPVATRFKPGNNCSRGRPKKKKTVGQLIEVALNTKVRITVDGKSVIMTKQQVVIHNLVNAAARGDRKAISTLFDLSDRYQDSAETVVNPSELSADDHQIIEEFLANATLDRSTLNTPNEQRPEASSAASEDPTPERGTET